MVRPALQNGKGFTHYARKKHGGYGTATYTAWSTLRARVSRGQEVAPEWADFERFRDDMGRRPDGTDLRRIDASKPWGPGNCEWRAR